MKKIFLSAFVLIFLSTALLAKTKHSISNEIPFLQGGW